MAPKCRWAGASLCLVILHLCPLPLSWAVPADPDFPEEYPEDAENLSIVMNRARMGDLECCLCSGFETCVVHYHTDNLTVYTVEEVGPQQDSSLTCQLYRCHHDYDKGQVICNREQRLLDSREMTGEIQFLTPQESRCHEICCMALIWSDPSESFYQDIAHKSGQESCNSSCLQPTSTTMAPTSTFPVINTTSDVDVTKLDTWQVTNASTVVVGNSSGFETTIVPDNSTSDSGEIGSVSLPTNESSSSQINVNRTSDAIHGKDLEPTSDDTNWTIVIVCSILGVLAVFGIFLVYLKRETIAQKLGFHNSGSATTEQEHMNRRNNSVIDVVVDSASESLIQNETNF